MIRVSRAAIVASIDGLMEGWPVNDPDAVNGMEIFQLRKALETLLSAEGNIVAYSVIRDRVRTHGFDDPPDPTLKP